MLVSSTTLTAKHLSCTDGMHDLDWCCLWVFVPKFVAAVAQLFQLCGKIASQHSYFQNLFKTSFCPLFKNLLSHALPNITASPSSHHISLLKRPLQYTALNITKAPHCNSTSHYNGGSSPEGSKLSKRKDFIFSLANIKEIEVFWGVWIEFLLSGQIKFLQLCIVTNVKESKIHCLKM